MTTSPELTHKPIPAIAVAKIIKAALLITVSRCRCPNSSASARI